MIISQKSFRNCNSKILRKLVENVPLVQASAYSHFTIRLGASLTLVAVNARYVYR